MDKNMREILFRAKRVDNGEWVEGYYTKLKWCNNIIHVVIPDKAEIDSGNSLLETYEINPETTCQYTGLTDKNGNRIWENDIVLCKKYLDGNFVEYHIERGFVEMKYGAYGLHRFKPNAYYRPFKDWMEDYEYEVIGNCFDNPELLKGE